MTSGPAPVPVPGMGNPWIKWQLSYINDKLLQYDRKEYLSEGEVFLDVEEASVVRLQLHL